MRKLVILITLFFILALPVSAMDLAPPTVPEDAQDLMPAETESFADGLWQVLKKVVALLEPELLVAAGQCLCLVAVVLAASLLEKTTGAGKKSLSFAVAIGIGGVLLQGTDSLIRMAANTVTQLSEYGKLLLPVLTAGMAAQGGVTSSAALYTGTVVFDAVLSSLISRFLVPMIYVFLALSIASAATGEEMLTKLRDFIKWAASWLLKILLYVFTGYMSITGVVSGTADASALKAAKLTISGVVPVVGGILSDASEAVLVSAGVMKTAAGVYGLIAFGAIWISPFLRIGIQYLLLKGTAALCGSFGSAGGTKLIQSFAAAMGLLLAMTGAMCFLLLISTVCLLKGMN